MSNLVIWSFLSVFTPDLTIDNIAVSAVALMGAGKLRAGVRVRALKINSPAERCTLPDFDKVRI